MTNFRRLALVSGMAVLSAVALTPQAQAQSTDVDFSGNVPGTCTINSVTNGTLVLTSPTQLSAWVGAGAGSAPGYINVTCNAGTTFTINSITNNGTPTATFNNLKSVEVKLEHPTSGQITNNVGITPNGLGTVGSLPETSSAQGGSGSPLTNQTYNLPMWVINQDATPLPVGTYGFRVNVSLNPQ